jgi:hypothetical protein
MEGTWPDGALLWVFNDLTSEFLEVILILQKMQSFLHIGMNLTRQPPRTMHWDHHCQSPLPIPNIRTDPAGRVLPYRMDRGILPQLPPDQQIAVNHLRYRDLVDYLEPLLAALLTNRFSVLDAVSSARANFWNPAIVNTLRRISTEQSTPNALLRGLRDHAVNSIHRYYNSTQERITQEICMILEQ